MLLTVTEVAKMLRVNRNHIYKLINDGELKAVKIGSIKVRKTDLEEYIERNVYKWSLERYKQLWR